jgi:hypothetical protein
MNKTLIQFCFRQVIDTSAKTDFEKDIFKDSYQEFQLQSQAYNRENKLRTLQELIENNPKANSLHYKVGFAIGLYLQKLNNIIPCLTDEAGNGISFSSYEFKIISSEIGNSDSHKVAINYTTPVFTLMDNFEEYMVLSDNDPAKNETSELTETFTLKMQDGLSVVRYGEVFLQDASLGPFE